MVERYQQHQKDLRFLKDLFGKNRKLYNRLLRSTKKNSVYMKNILLIIYLEKTLLRS